jgi:hypothetical protein
MLKSIVVLVLLLILAGCAGTVNKSPNSQEIIVRNNLNPAGKNLFVKSDSKMLAEFLGESHATEFVQKLQNYFVKNGFALVTESYAAHVTILIQPVVITKPAQRKIDIIGFFHQYGLRPKQFFYFGLNVDNEFPSHSIANMEQAMAKIKLTAPASDMKMPGLPGCMPSFYLHVTEKKDNERLISVIEKIDKSSPPEKAGLQIGDEILRFNGEPYTPFSTAKVSDQIYEEKLPVVVEVRRGNTKIIATLRAQVKCR